MNRYDLLKIIPKPKNEEVIVYDTTLTPLIDINVINEYYITFAKYKNQVEKFMQLDKEIKEYKEQLNSMYLYNKKWNEQDYVEMLQKDKKQYSTLFHDVKKIEDNIKILEKKRVATNEKIKIQQAKEEKEIQKKKENIDKEIETSKEQLQELKLEKNDIKIKLDKIIKEITENENEKNEILIMINSLNNDAYVCKYCGTTITHKSSKKRVFNLLQRLLEKNQTENKELLDKKYQIEQDLAYFKNETSKIKAILKNDLEFKTQDYTFYRKKSLEVLKLEAINDTTLNKIEELKKQYKSKNEIYTKTYKELKDRINKYEISLENIRKIRNNKEIFKENFAEFNKAKQECITLKEKLLSYKNFISIYYKIYEQKANNYFGKDFKFKFAKFNDLELQEIFEIKYKDIDYYELDKKSKQEVDKIYAEKIYYFS